MVKPTNRFFHKFNNHKYKAKPTIVDGIKFGSILEADYYRTLKFRVSAGIVTFFLRQVPFHLPGGVVYRVDFQEFHSDGTIHFVEIKGFPTPEWKIKYKQVEALYPVTIEVKTRKDVKKT